MKLLAGLLTLLVAMSAPAADTDSVEAQVIALEKQSWAAWQSHDAKFFEGFLSDDHVEVHGYGVTGKADVVRGVGSDACKVESYSLGDFRFRRLSDESVMLVYRAEQKTLCGGAPVPSPVWTSSVYAKRGGRWLNVLFQQTAIR
jgi:Domain of unknown function (DUF4440)